MLTRTEIEQVAQAVHAYRPDWPVASLCSFLRRHENRPLRDVALELTFVALDPSSKTPARIESDGPWKQITRPLGQPVKQYPVARPDFCILCQVGRNVHQAADHDYENPLEAGPGVKPTPEQKVALEAARIEAEKKRTAERKPEPTRELRDPVEVVNAHLEEKSA